MRKRTGLQRNDGIARLGRAPRARSSILRRPFGIAAIQRMLAQMQQRPGMTGRQRQHAFPQACRRLQPPGLHLGLGPPGEAGNSRVLHHAGGHVRILGRRFTASVSGLPEPLQAAGPAGAGRFVMLILSACSP